MGEEMFVFVTAGLQQKLFNVFTTSLFYATDAKVLKKQVCLFQETTWNPKNSYILICKVRSEEAGPHLVVLNRRKLIRKYSKC